MSAQPILPFDITARKHGGNAESRAANLAALPTKESWRNIIMDFAASRGTFCITADEVAVFFVCNHNTTSPRIAELRGLG